MYLLDYWFITKMVKDIARLRDEQEETQKGPEHRSLRCSTSRKSPNQWSSGILIALLIKSLATSYKFNLQFLSPLWRRVGPL